MFTYIGHKTNTTRIGKDSFRSVLLYLSGKNIFLHEVVKIKCDGSYINIGLKKGVIQNFKMPIGRPLYWYICLLHFLTLLFMHFFKHIDEKRTGPALFSSPMGKQLKNLQLTIQSFNCFLQMWLLIIYFYVPDYITFNKMIIISLQYGQITKQFADNFLKCKQLLTLSVVKFYLMNCNILTIT